MRLDRPESVQRATSLSPCAAVEARLHAARHLGSSRPPGALLTTLVAFFLVEMGDKAQLATVALGARIHDVTAVFAGTTLGMTRQVRQSPLAAGVRPSRV